MNHTANREIVQTLNNNRNVNSDEFELDVVWSMICNSRKQIASVLCINYASCINRGLVKNHQLDCDDFLKFVENLKSINVEPVLRALQTKVVQAKDLNQVASIMNHYYVHKKVSTSKTKEFVDGEKIEFDGELVSAKMVVSFGVYTRIQTQVIMIDDDNNRYVWYKSGWSEFENKASNRIHFKGKSKSISDAYDQPTLTVTRGKITE